MAKLSLSLAFALTFCTQVHGYLWPGLFDGLIGGGGGRQEEVDRLQDLENHLDRDPFGARDSWGHRDPWGLDPEELRIPEPRYHVSHVFQPIKWPKIDFGMLPKTGSSSSSSSSHSSFGSFKSSDGKNVKGKVFGNSVQSKCDNGKCTATINGKEYHSDDGSYAQSMITDSCPPAFTSFHCSFVTAKDGCPMGKCQGFGTREPCETKIDCGTGALKCKHGVCIYQVPKGRPTEVLHVIEHESHEK